MCRSRKCLDTTDAEPDASLAEPLAAICRRRRIGGSVVEQPVVQSAEARVDDQCGAREQSFEILLIVWRFQFLQRQEFSQRTIRFERKGDNIFIFKRRSVQGCILLRSQFVRLLGSRADPLDDAERLRLKSLARVRGRSFEECIDLSFPWWSATISNRKVGPPDH